MSKTPSDEIRKIKAYLDGYVSGLEHAQDAQKVVGGTISIAVQAELSALHNITWFLIEEFGDFEVERPVKPWTNTGGVFHPVNPTLLNSLNGD